MTPILQKMSKVIAGVALTAIGALLGQGQPAKITVDAQHPAHAISPTLWGLFFEDINLSADGGIYPELVRNRSFEDADKPADWTVNGAEASIDRNRPLNPYNRKSLRLKTDGSFSVVNEGYWGMNIVQGDGYTLKLAARAESFSGKLTAKLVGASGTVLASGEISGMGKDWKYQTVDLLATGSDAKAKLELSGEGKGVLFLDMVSVLPKKTWKNHGLRVDLAESLAGLQPKFLRFPGGCWVEGDDMAHMNRWKKTIGNIDVREPLWNIWGYFATHGLGYHEYLQLSEDLGATPLFCINVGMSHKESIPLDRINEWVQDALDAIEYANGSTNTLWGSARAIHGHPEPFNLEYLEIGNENGGPAYRERWALFVEAIRARYPNIKVIANHWQGGYPSHPRADVVDEHFYDTPEWFMRHANHFDKYDRNGPKIFVGEYAVTRNCGLGNLRGAIGEAAFMTGLERNSDHVVMASYAPLLVNLNHRAWNPDLINFDSAKWYGLPSYYVQKLFAENRGDQYLPTAAESPVEDAGVRKGMIGVGTWNTAAEFKEIRVTAPDGKVLFSSDFSQGTQGWNLLGGGADWKVQDGMLRQNAQREFIRALAGDKEWTDYTLTLKARKISGAEGFLVLFRIQGQEDRTWWNIGGWSNTADAIEAGGTMDSKPGQIETGRWYDLRVEVKGGHVKCVMDGQVIHDLDFDRDSKITSLYASAAKDARTGELILKVVNASAQALETAVDLRGAQLTGEGTVTVLTSAHATDENSLAEPTKVAPKVDTLKNAGSSFNMGFPGNSLSVLRLRVK